MHKGGSAFAFPWFQSGNLRTAQLFVKRVLRCIKSMRFLLLLLVGRRVIFESKTKLKVGSLGVKLRGLSPGRDGSPSLPEW